MKAEDKNPLQRVRIAVLGNVNVGKSGKLWLLNSFLRKLSSIIFVIFPNHFAHFPLCDCFNSGFDLLHNQLILPIIFLPNNSINGALLDTTLHW